MPRCAWAVTELGVRYHDEEWGVPARDDRTLFEFIILEGAQAGLSWETILRKRERYRELYFGFDPGKVARLDARWERKALADPGIVRNRLKVHSSIQNARAFLELAGRHGSFAAFLAPYAQPWRVKDGPRLPGDVPTRTPASDALSKALRAHGFNFVGSTICYAFMQAVGLVNDHLVTCPRRREIPRGPWAQARDS